jgi:hypothetical protein
LRFISFKDCGGWYKADHRQRHAGEPGLGHMAVGRNMDSDAVAAVAAFEDREVVQNSGHPEADNFFAPR